MTSVRDSGKASQSTKFNEINLAIKFEDLAGDPPNWKLVAREAIRIIRYTYYRAREDQAGEQNAKMKGTKYRPLPERPPHDWKGRGFRD